MRTPFFVLTLLVSFTLLLGCSNKVVNLGDTELRLVNREISSTDKQEQRIALSNRQGDGLAILDGVDFKTGTIEVDLKGENTPGRSFVGVAFNVQNDSTYEAIYFRPFNFRAEEKARREHAVQYISHPKHNWRFLRTNYEGQYEAEYDRQPAADEWFTVRIAVADDTVTVYDQATNSELLAVERLAEPASNKMGLWMGNNSKGAFKHLRISK